MKKLFLFLMLGLNGTILTAQHCLDIRTAAVADLVRVPDSAASAFRDCHTQQNNDGVAAIVNYGDHYADLDSFMTQKARTFSLETYANLQSPQMPSAAEVEDAKQLAATVNSMTEDQQKAFAMQMAQQQMNNSKHPAAAQEDPATIKLIMETASLSGQQLYGVAGEYRTKASALQAAAQQEEESLKEEEVDWRKCPELDRDGSRSCACMNGCYLQFWKKKVAIQDKYNRQMISLSAQYAPKIKALCAQIDDNIKKLRYGDAIKTPGLKQKLLSTQAQAFSLACEVLASPDQYIRKSSSDIYVNQYNCQRNVYVLNCTR
jgi:hypothetical protein